MSEKRVPLKAAKERPHHVIIPLEEWGSCSIKDRLALRDRYGISLHRLNRRRNRCDAEGRTFLIKTLVPFFVSHEEILDFEGLRRIAKERHLNYLRVCWARKYRMRVHSQKPKVAVCSVPAAPPLDTRDALAQVFSARTASSFGVHLLVIVQNEDAEERGTFSPMTDPAVRTHLERLPLRVLHHFISHLQKIRAVWQRDLLTPSAECAAQAQMLSDRETINATLFHVCLWQRRYPLELVSALLSFFDEYTRSHSTETRFTPAQLESLLEEVHSLHYQDLSDVPGLIRCDVFMTYPHMPLEEQRRLMRKIAAIVAHRQATRDLPHRNTGVGSKEETAYDNLVKHSRTPPDPRLLLLSFMADGRAAIPERFCAIIPTEQYHAVRVAFELHKQDGVRRLAVHDYGREQLPP